MAPKKNKASKAKTNKSDAHWTPDRVQALIAKLPKATGTALADTIGVTRALVSLWTTGQHTPSPIHVFALDCLARQYGLKPSKPLD